ncbi:MAG: hypothetical protein QM762_25125 [Chryseolinea sp.]
MRVNPTLATMLFISLLHVGCSALRESPKYQLSDGNYLYKREGQKYEKVRVYVVDDSVGLRSAASGNIIPIDDRQKQYFLMKSFDVDVTTTLFKYRPATENLPRQLNPEFNGNVFIGYRFDRFTIYHETTPFGSDRHHKHWALTGGVFGGFGSTQVTPWTTNYRTQDEYGAFILSRGVACLIGLKTITVGLAVGWDWISDRDQDIWIYQNKPWYGLTVGLNLN